VVQVSANTSAEGPVAVRGFVRFRVGDTMTA